MSGPMDIPSLSPSTMGPTQFPSPHGNGGGDSGRRAGVAPSHRSSLHPISPHSQIPRPSISRSMSQPSSVFPFPPLSPSPIPFMKSNPARASRTCLPPRKAHKSASSEIIAGLNSLLAQNSPQLIYPKPVEMPVGANSQKEATDEPFSGYMDLDSNSTDSAVESIASESESESESGKEIVSKKTSGVKRRAGKETAPSSRHCRSVSVDSGLNGPPPSVGGNETAFTLDVADGMFTESEIKTIAASKKLSKKVATQPKNVKRILVNRVSAARSKERKAQYVADLEHKVETLSAHFKNLQGHKMALETENRELRIRLEGMEKQAQLRDTLVDQLTGEVKRLKVATGEESENRSESNFLPVNADMFQLLDINQFDQAQTSRHFE